MKTHIKYMLIAASFLFFYNTSFSQENFASNITSSVSGDEKLLITYDIVNTGNIKSFSVIMMLTHEGRQIKASSVYGDIGSNIKKGTEKAIVWYFKNDFNGNIENVNVEIFAYKENEPQAIFKIESISNNGYAPCQIVFSNSSSYANEYQWDFGDPASGSLNHSFKKEPSHIFKKGGIYSIALIARNTQLQLENTYYQSIEIKTHEKTTADFIIEGNNQMPPAKVNFINKSINADVFHWNFGDPASKKKNESRKRDEKHKYSAPGTYPVQLIVKNNFSLLSDTIVKEVIVEQALKPEASFVFTKSSEIVPTTVVFKNMSKSGSSYKWDFGDPMSGENNTSEEVDPAHVYTKPGSYEVVLLAYSKGEKKPSRYTETIIVKDLPKPPEAKFSIVNNNVLGPATIVFSNSSKNATSYNWDFGDPQSGTNNISDKENPTHTYKTAGTYKVTLTATNDNFNEVSIYSDNVIITQPDNPPVANFSISNNNSTAPSEINFINLSQNADNYSWDFGDVSDGKNISSEKSPKHKYTKAGRYKVVLTAINSKTGEESIFSDFVIINEPTKRAVKPVANFSLEKTTLPCPAIVSFTNNSTNANSFLWDFGDPNSEDNSSVLEHPTHIYSTPGRYMVTLTVTNDITGSTEKFTSFVTVTEPAKPVVRPVAKWDIDKKELIAPASVLFSNTSTDADTYEWNFGDIDSPDNISTKKNPTHIFKKAGRYKVRLTVTNSSSGLTNSFSNFISVTEPLAEPIADFEIQNNGALQPATVVFTNKSTNANSYAWDFGDNLSGNRNTSVLENPQHIYENAGEYKVVLAVLNKETGQEDIIEKTVIVNKPIEPPVANFEITFNGEFAPLNVQFNNLSTNADTFIWDFGDEFTSQNSSNIESPTHYYNNPGTYTVTLTASNSETGKSNTISKKVSLKSSFATFTKTKDLPGNNKKAFSIAKTSNDEVLVVMNNLKNKATVVKIDNKGVIVESKQFNYQLFDIVAKDKGRSFMMLGVNSDGKLLVQSINRNLKTEEAIFSPNSKSFKIDFAQPRFALSTTNEIGIIANTINDKYPINLFFEKRDKDGKNIALNDRTFKYIGIKTAYKIAPTTSGGFCITGSWKKDNNALRETLFSRIDKTGRGEIHLISAQVNNFGLDIAESYQNGFAVLRAKEDFDDKNRYELSFILINKDGSPTDCANSLPSIIRKEEIDDYKPTLIKTKDGYLIATHSFNGAEYNIKLFWFDTSGNILVKHAEIKLPGNQFVMDVVETSDGGLMIVGTDRLKNSEKAMIIKTDSSGQIYH